VRIVREGLPVAHYGFNLTAARLVSGLITERGVLQSDSHAPHFQSGREGVETSTR